MHFQPPPGYQPIYNPIVPYTGPIYGGLKLGMSLCIQGTVLNGADRFHINLQTGLVGVPDIALHFNPRFKPSECVVMNIKEGGKWQTHEIPSETPFHDGESFQLLFIVISEGYQIKVNGSDYYLFKHRMPVERVSALSIVGDVSVHVVNIIGGGIGHVLGYPGLGQMVSIPYAGLIYGGLRTGMSVHIQGAIPCDVTRFHVSLQSAEAKCSDKALYINPRFNPKEFVVFNTFQNGKFEEQERVTDMPFILGESFELVIIVTGQGYQVSVNGGEFYVFKHRMPSTSVLALGIGGDVFVESVNIMGGGQEAIQAWPGPGYIGADEIRQPIHGGLKAGMLLYLRGTLPKDMNRFDINLEGGGDLVVHFNPRFNGWRGVVFNTRDNGEWQAEEKVDKMPFRKGESFELVFFVTSEGYQVNVDGRELHMYKHRVPLEQVTDLVIAGEVSVQTINIIMVDQEVIPGYPGPEDEQGLIQEYPGPGDVKSTPLSQAIDGGLKPGTSLYFQGKVHSEINRFHINLEAGSDIAMHFKVNFIYTELLAFNTLLNGGWQTEEKLDQMPFRKDQDFDLLISATLKGYQVIVNGCMIHMYKHRIPLDRVTSLIVGGDVSVKSIAIIKGSRGDEIEGGLWYNWRFLPMMGKQPIYNPPIPYTMMIPGGLTPKKTIAFSGRVLPDADRIIFNFNVSSSGDIALHFNPRMNKGSVVRNSYLRGTWGAEERDVKFNPFRQGRYFEILIRCETQKLMFFGNGKYMFDFYHRFQPFTKIDTLHISGGVQLSHLLL